MKLYLDMDGVLADFDGKTLKEIGKTLSHFKTSKEGWDAISHFSQNMFFELEKMPDADHLVSEVFSLSQKYKFDVGVLTAIPKVGRIPLAETHKKLWLYKRYPQLLDNFNVGPHAVDKQNHCSAGDILIDDSPLNIPQWNAKGGIGILHKNAAESLKILKEHLRSKYE